MHVLLWNENSGGLYLQNAARDSWKDAVLTKDMLGIVYSAIKTPTRLG